MSRLRTNGVARCAPSFRRVSVTGLARLIQVMRFADMEFCSVRPSYPAAVRGSAVIRSLISGTIFFRLFFYRKPRVEVFKEPYWLLAPLIILILFFYREGCFVVVIVFNIYSPFSPWFFWCPFLILPHSPGIFCFVFFLAAVHSFFSLFLSRKVSADLSSVSTSGGFRCRVHRCCDFRSTPFLAPMPLPPSPASSCTLSRFSARAVLH